MIVLVGVDIGDGAEDWAGEVLAGVLGRPTVDARIFEIDSDSMATGSTQRLMWDQMSGQVCLITRLDAGRIKRWFAEHQIDLDRSMIRLLAGATDPHAAANFGDSAAAGRGGPDDQHLDDWIDAIDV